MKRLALAALLLSLSGIALAQSSAAATEPAEPAEPADVVVLAADQDEKPLADRNCLRNTGTHISARRTRNECTNAPGRSYDRDDIAKTGANTPGEALERLDPSVTIRRR